MMPPTKGTGCAYCTVTGKTLTARQGGPTTIVSVIGSQLPGHPMSQPQIVAAAGRRAPAVRYWLTRARTFVSVAVALAEYVGRIAIRAPSLAALVITSYCWKRNPNSMI